MSKNLKVSKKRKASVSSNSQTTLDAFRRVASPLKISKDSTAENRDDDSTAMVIDPPSNPFSKDNVLNVSSVFGTFSRHSLVRKIPIRHYHATSLLPMQDSYFARVWDNQQKLILTIFQKKPIDQSLQEAYEGCANICRLQKAEELFTKLEDQVSLQIQRIAGVLESATNQSAPILELVNQNWNELCSQMGLIQNIFMELDRQYLVRKTRFTSIVNMGKQYFGEYLVSNPTVFERIIQDILTSIEDDRNGKSIDSLLLQSLLNMMQELNIYTSHFEQPFLDSTYIYYHQEYLRLSAVQSVPEYLLHVKNRVNQEESDRLERYLHRATWTPLYKCVTRKLLLDHTQDILDNGFDSMMANQDKEPLHILYELLAPTHDITLLRSAFSTNVKKQGTELLKDPAKDSTMIISLLNYKKQLDGILKDCFNNDTSFANALKESFEMFVNSRRSKPAELLAKFIDGKLKSSGKKSAGEDLEQLLDQLLVIFRYLQGKDTFEAFYKRFLAKRLLLSRSASEDLEKSVLSKLKTECGPGFTKNLEAMFNDIAVSSDLNNQFKGSEEYQELGDIQFQVNVLAQGIWPSYGICNVEIPSAMHAYQVAYEKFYTTKFSGRRLTWQNALASCIVKANFSSGNKDLYVSLFQTVLLLLFNDNDMLSYGAISQATKLEDKELKRILHSLSCGQHKVLIKEPQTNDIDDKDLFSYNTGFKAAPVRLKFNVLQQEYTSDERKATQSKVLVDRQHQLEAAIVRIMKAKKKLSHTDLMNELFEQVKFPLEAGDIKKRIESLIDRDYLSRDQSINGYIYQ